MAESMKAIRNRIRSVESTRQITKAMELVAAGKLGRARERLDAARPYFQVLRDMIYRISRGTKSLSSPFVFPAAEDARVCRIVIAGDRGLAGGYNGNLFRSANAAEGDIIVPIGRKAVEYYSRRGFELLTEDYSVAEKVSFADCAKLSKTLSEDFLNGRFGRLVLNYTSFVSVLEQRPSATEILPVAAPSEPTEKPKLILYDPSAESVFEKLIPQYTAGMIYGALRESIVSELSARRMAMDAANKNADEMIDSLSLSYNRARQAAITQEITEIVAGS